MHKLNVPRIVKLTLALLSCSTLVVGIDWNAPAPAAPLVPAQSECAGEVKDCKWPVKRLGEKDGCACFACEYGKKTQRVICTRNEKDKGKLRELELERTPPRDGPAPRARRGRARARARTAAESHLG